MPNKQKTPSTLLPKYKLRSPKDATAAFADIEEKKPARRGRPPLGDKAKGIVTIRLDADVLESYRGLGAGWQTKINADLRRARKLKKGRPLGSA